MVPGIILCCLKEARGHFLCCQHFQRTLERKILERMERDQSNIENPPYIWDWHYSTPSQPSPTGQINARTLHGGCFPTLTYSQEDFHSNLQENIARQTSRLGSRRLPVPGSNSPAHHPLRTAHRRSSTLGRLVPTAETIFNSSVREPDRIELPPSSPLPTLPRQPIPARRLRVGFPGVEQDFS